MIITLLTDFGTRDHFVGAMKGVILSLNPEARIVDITHEIPPQDINAAGFSLFACYKNFPRRTIHLSVVDPGVGSERRAILAVSGEQYFIAPDNGLLSFIYAAEENIKVFELNRERFFQKEVSRTFHGRDIFAPVAAWLSRGVLPEELGDEIADFVRFEIGRPQKAGENTLRGEILHVDRFGNCITNFDKQLLPESFHLEIKGHKVAKLQNFYAEADDRDKLFMLFGSAGLLEISAFRDSAAEIMNVEAGERVLAHLISEING
jgi:S-adenosylmethionine hydrolase